MRTDERLDRAYDSARIEIVDGGSRYVIVSDCHRADGSLADEFTRNRHSFRHALEHYFDAGFTYVEAGDGDELWEHSDYRHIKDAHTDEFRQMKRFHDEGRLVRLWGNHDNHLRDPAFVEANLYTYYDEYTQAAEDLFPGLEPCEALVLRDRETGQEFMVVHGHQGDFANDQAWYFTMLSARFFWRHLHAIGVRNPVSPVKNAWKRHKLETNYDEWIARSRRALVCGHTHRTKFPRPGELPYFNAGSCVYPTSISAIEIAERSVSLVKWMVMANAEGELEVERRVLAGPKPLSDFDIR